MKKILLFLLLTIQSFVGFSQNPADVDLTFPSGANPGFSNSVLAVKIQSDNKIIVGGSFINYCGINSNYITRLNIDGTIDQNFEIGSGFNSNVQAIKIQTDGKILVGGAFTTYNGSSYNKLIRLNSNGSIDTNFNIGTGFDGNVNTIAVQSDGKIIIGGDFTIFNSVSKLRIIRLNSDGSIDSSFLGWANNTVRTVEIQNDNKIIVGGDFTTFSSLGRNRIARLNTNGSVDSTFQIGVGFDDTVYTTYIQTDGKILVGGKFLYYNYTGGITALKQYIVRLNNDGAWDNTFFGGDDLSSIVYDIKVQSTGKIIAVGAFAGTGMNKIFRFDSNGNGDASFATNIGTGGNATINSIALFSNDNIIIGGNHITFNSITCNRLSSLNNDGLFDNNFAKGLGFNNAINDIQIQNDSKVLIAGNFTSHNGLQRNRISRLNSDGTLDVNFNSGAGFSDQVNSIAIQSDNKIIVGGNFNNFNGALRVKIARLNSNGTIDNSFSGGFNNNVNVIKLQSDGKILAGGVFTSYTSNSVTTSCNRLIRLNSDGSNDTSFNIGSGFNGDVNCIKILANGKIMIGGNFTTFNGVTQNKLILLNSDGSKDSSFNIGSGFNDLVRTLESQPDGKILVGGNFTNFNGVTQNRFIRLNTNGSKDTAFNIGTGFNQEVNSIVIQPDGKIITGGWGFIYNGVTSNFIIRLNIDGAINNSFNIGSGFNNITKAIKLESDGKIWAGGSFTFYNGTNSNYLIKLKGETTLSTTAFSKTKITLYPNPTKDILNFTLPENNTATAYEINNLLGEKVSYGNLNTNSISVSNLANGVYIVKINTSEGVLTEKFIKE